MANYLRILCFVVLLALWIGSCHCFPYKLLNVSMLQSDESEWSSAVATWYGPPEGAGSDGGACGYGNAVEQPPFSALVSAGGPSLFDGGRGCGACYHVKCTSNVECSGNPVSVVIADYCPGCSELVHFDLSGHAIRAMAKDEQAEQLQNAGRLLIDYQRVECNYPGTTLAFHVQMGSSDYYFATLIIYEGGDGDLASVDLKQRGDASDQPWLSMDLSWGAIWKFSSGASPLQAPLSIRLTTRRSGKAIFADNVIPEGWQPDQIYHATVANAL